MTISAIMIDSREPKWVHDLKFDGVFKAVTALEYGDAWITTDDGDMICIERKAPSDLLNSIQDDRLFCQARGIRERSPWSYIVVTGTLAATVTGLVVVDGHSTGWRFDSIWGALLTVQEMGVRVVFCGCDDDYEATVKRLCNRRRGGEYVIEATIDTREMNSGEKFLTSLPGIGIDTAKTLLEEFDNRACDALAWLTWHRWNTDFHIAGIGEGKKRAVRSAIGMDDKMVFDVVPDEMLQAATTPKPKEERELMFA